MPENIRALIVILALAAPAFYLGRRIASSVITNGEFVFWRNAWFAVTIVAFLTTNIFIYVAMILAVCLYARWAGTASVGLYYILLFAAPLGKISIGGAGIVNRLLDVNNGSLLGIFLLLPILLAARGFDRRQLGAYSIPDRLVVGYVLLLTALQFRGSEATVTSVMRAGTSYALDVLIPYFAFSRMVTSMADVRKVLLAFIIAALPLSLIAVFEMAKRWHLYSSLVLHWGGDLAYLQRDGMLRASSAAVVSIALGFVIMVAVGCMVGIWHTVRPLRPKGIILAIFACGLIATLSRGPWVGVAVLLLVYFAIGPNAPSNLGKLAVAGAVAATVLLILPGGTRLLDLLPFIGSAEEGSVTYRADLFTHAMAVIQLHPLFGTVDYRAEPEMLEMMQGEHIIDIVNSYLEITLRSGLIGLGLFISFFAAILIGLRRVLKFQAVTDRNFKACVRASIGILISMLVTIATVSIVDFIPYVLWPFAGICVALIRVGYKERSAALALVNANRAHG